MKKIKIQIFWLFVCFFWTACFDTHQEGTSSVNESDLYSQAKKAYNGSDFTKSLQLYYQILPSLDRPYLDSAIYNMGYCQLQLDSLEEAIKLFSRAAELNHRKADALFNIGLIYYALTRCAV